MPSIPNTYIVHYLSGKYIFLFFILLYRIFLLTQSSIIRFKKFRIESSGKDIIIAGKRLLKKIAIKHVKECCSMDHLSSMQSFKKVLMKGMHTSVECLVQVYISPNILRRAISMFMALEVELDVPRTKIEVVILVTGRISFFVNNFYFITWIILHYLCILVFA